MSLRTFRDALIVMGAFLAVIWVLQVVNWADGYRLDTQFGILPEHVSRLPEIFTAPFLHFSWQHIEGNSVPLFVLGVLAAYRSIARFLIATLIIAVTSGLAVWLFQSSNELTVGASGLIFGYFGYVLVRGFFDRNLIDIGVGLVAEGMYWTILQVALPGTPGVSWIGHRRFPGRRARPPPGPWRARRSSRTAGRCAPGEQVRRRPAARAQGAGVLSFRP